MSTIREKITYPFWFSAVHAAVTFFSLASDCARVEPRFLQIFILLRICSGVLALGMMWWSYGRSQGDALCGAILANLMLYAVFNSWFLPVFEAAYFEAVIAGAFFKFQRRWIFPSIALTGFLGFIVSYQIQSQIHWTTPAPLKVDWVMVMIICFVASWVIHEFAIGSYRREQERYRRYSMIGFEATRLIHDIKGMIATPLLLVDHLRNPENSLERNDMIKNLNVLSDDMISIRRQLQQINLLVSNSRKNEEVNVRESCERALNLFGRRLAVFKVTLPDSRLIKGNAEVLQSVLFNLLLNCVEAFEKNKFREGTIDIFWRGKDLVVKDNCKATEVSVASPDEFKTGLGLEIAREDLRNMGAKLKINRLEQGTEVILQLKPVV